MLHTHTTIHPMARFAFACFFSGTHAKDKSEAAAVIRTAAEAFFCSPLYPKESAKKMDVDHPTLSQFACTFCWASGKETLCWIVSWGRGLGQRY